jgi:cell shape-determining protein MreD
MPITSVKGTFVFKFLREGWSMGVWQDMFKFSHYALRVFVFALSILILGTILLWTLDHTDIVAFVTVLLFAISLEGALIFALFKTTAIPENIVGDQRTSSGMLPTLILAKMAKLPKLVRKS